MDNPCNAEVSVRIFFVHLELELLTQFPAPNEIKIVLLMKNRNLPNRIICPIEHLPQNIVAILVLFCLI